MYGDIGGGICTLRCCSKELGSAKANQTKLDKLICSAKGELKSENVERSSVLALLCNSGFRLSKTSVRNER